MTAARCSFPTRPPRSPRPSRRTDRRAGPPRLLALPTVLLASLLGTALLLAPSALAGEVAEQVLADMPELVELLPRRPGSGRLIGIEEVREMQRFMERKIEREAVRRHFPAHTKTSDPGRWREVEVQGRRIQVPNESHPAYGKMAAEFDRRVRKNDAEFQERFGRRYETFSRRVFDALRGRPGAAEGDVRLVGRHQNSHHSDIDATFRDPEVRRQVLDAFARHGLTVEGDPEGHGLYDKVKEVDWLLWQDRTVADLARDDPRYQAAMADREVGGTNVGAREHVFGEGVRDGKGTRLDHIKKYAQSRDGYTRNKIVGKLEDLDRVAPRARTAEAAQAMREHQGSTRALRTIGWPEPAKQAEEAAFQARRQEDLVDSYRRAALEHHGQQRQRNRMVAAYRDLSRRFQASGEADLATRYDAEARRVMRESAALTRTNAETMKAIEVADPPLGRRLRAAERMAEAEYRRRARAASRGKSSRQSDDSAPARRASSTGDAALARSMIDEATPPSAFLPVTKDMAGRIMRGTDAVFGHAGTAGTYLGIMDEALRLEAEGKGSVAGHMAKGVTKQAATAYVAKKIPVVGAVLELVNVPGTLMAEFDRELDRVDRGETSELAAKTRAIWTTMKKSTFIGTYERILQEEGMDEVGREIESGRYDWAGVALRTTYRTTGEVTGLNNGLRAIANLSEGVHDAIREERLATGRFRDAVSARTRASERDLAALRGRIIELQLRPDADHPDIRRRLEKLQRRHDATLDDVHGLAQRMRRNFSGRDRQTEELYARASFGKQAQRVELTRARMIRLATVEDTTSPSVLDRLIEHREEHRKHLQELRSRCQELLESRGDDDSLASEMLARLRHAQRVQQDVDAIDVKAELARGEARDREERQRARDAWFAEVEAEQRRRRAEQARMERALRDHAEADRTTYGIDPEDQALLVELDDLRLRQEEGELAEDADLLDLAYRNVGRDATWHRLHDQQRRGELAEDADLGALLERYDALASRLGAGELTADADLLALALDGSGAGEGPGAADGEPQQEGADPFAFVDAAANDEIWQGCCLGRLPPVELAEPLTDEVPYASPPSVRRRSDGSPQEQYGEIEVDGRKRRHGKNLKWRGGVLFAETFYLRGDLHGRSRTWKPTAGHPLVREAYHRRGKRHGPDRRWTEEGVLFAETWYRDGEKHGPERRFNRETGAPTREDWWRDGERYGPDREWRDGKIASDSCFGEDAEKFLVRRYHHETGNPRLLRVHDLERGERGRRPTLERRFFDEDGELRSESRTDGEGRPEGLQKRHRRQEVGGRERLFRQEELYGEDDHLLRQRQEWCDDQLVLEQPFTVVDGESVPDGVHRTYSPPGSPRAGEILLEEHYRAGVRHGRYRRFDAETGALLAEGNFSRGLLDGSWRWNHPDGTSFLTTTYHRGFHEGASEVRDTEGRLVVEVYESGGQPSYYRVLFQGVPYYEYQGTLKVRACQDPKPRQEPERRLPRALNDLSGCGAGRRWRSVRQVEDGVYRRWFRDGPGKGKPEFVFPRRRGEPHGEWKYYYPDGTLLGEERYRDGKLHGTQRCYYQDGTLWWSVEMAGGVRHGRFEYFDRQGVRRQAGTCKNGWLEGWYEVFHPTGAIRSRAHYSGRKLDRAGEIGGGRGFEWKGVSHHAYSEDRFGPQVKYRPDGAIEKVSFGLHGNWTEDWKEYARWREEHPDLPATAPGLTPPEADTRPAVDLSSVPAPPSGLSPQEAHMKMMELWQGSNQALSDGDYRRGEELGLQSVRLALAYESEGLRPACIGYNKAIACARRADAPGRVRAYLEAALALARRPGGESFIESYQRQLAELH